MDSSSLVYRVKRSKRAKRLALRLNIAERIFDLVVPMRCSMEVAYDFADQHEDWMGQKLEELSPLIPIIHNQILPFDGMQLKVQINSDNTLKRTNITLNNNILLVDTNKDDPSARIIRWMKTYTQKILEQKSHEKAAYIRKRIEKVSVRETKSRWGSCSQDGNLSYNWRLIFAPPEALDYVVAHEVAHLTHLDHSKKFWSLCQDLSDDYEYGKGWMKEHGHTLMSYGAKSSSCNQGHPEE